MEWTRALLCGQSACNVQTTYGSEVCSGRRAVRGREESVIGPESHRCRCNARLQSSLSVLLQFCVEQSIFLTLFWTQFGWWCGHQCGDELPLLGRTVRSGVKRNEGVFSVFCSFCGRSQFLRSVLRSGCYQRYRQWPQLGPRFCTWNLR